MTLTLLNFEPFYLDVNQPCQKMLKIGLTRKSSSLGVTEHGSSKRTDQFWFWNSTQEHLNAAELHRTVISYVAQYRDKTPTKLYTYASYLQDSHPDEDKKGVIPC